MEMEMDMESEAEMEWEAVTHVEMGMEMEMELEAMRLVGAECDVFNIGAFCCFAILLMTCEHYA